MRLCDNNERKTHSTYKVLIPLSARFNIRTVDPAVVDVLERTLGVPHIVAATLVARGIESPQEAREFLNPSLERDWRNPYDIPGMAEVADGLEAAIRDGKRILGDNKTWIGFTSMVALTAASQVVWGSHCARRGLNALHDIYRVRENTLALNLVSGTLCGLAYAVCELPNSFVKRRIDIRPGKTESGAAGKVFFVIDQIDSLLVVFAVLSAYSGISWKRYVQYICLGAGTHVGVNFVLYKLHIRKNL